MSDIDAAQPDQGQDGAQETTGGHPSWNLDKYPADLRDFAAEVLRDHDGDVTRKFQEHSEYRRQWEPYENIEGLKDLDPEDLQGLIQFHQKIATEEGQQEVIDNLLSQVDEDQWARIGQENGWLDDDDGDDPSSESEPDQGLLAQIEQLLEQRLSPLEQRAQEEELRRQEQEIDQTIDQELEDLHEQYGDFDDEAVQALALAYDGDDALRQGLARYFQIRGDSQQDLILSKTQQPEPALNGGRPDTAPEPISGLRDPKLREATVRRLQGA